MKREKPRRRAPRDPAPAMIETEIQTVVQMVFKPQRLVVARAPADARIRDIRVVRQSQLVGVGDGVSAAVFGSQQVGLQLDLATANPGDVVSICVASEEGGVFHATLLGATPSNPGATVPLGFSQMLPQVEPLVELAKKKLANEAKARAKKRRWRRARRR
jgi:hypothetical protein